MSQVTASFTANNPTGCAPVFASFTSTSTGGPFASHLWYFGDGASAVTVAPSASHIYAIPGTYTVSLVVTGINGTDSVAQTNFITVFQAPDVTISANPVSGCLPLDVQFTDGSIAYPGPLTNWLWDFGDGQTSNLQNPSHTYPAAGTYTAYLSVTDANGCSAFSQNPVTINAFPDISANFTFSPLAGCNAPHTVTFSDASSGPGPFTYSWDFGDGSPLDNSPNPTHTYLTNSSFTVTLAIQNGNGCTDTLSIQNAITLVPLAANFGATPNPACVGSNVAFSDLSSGNPTAWEWDFGDGGTSTAQNPNHIYAAPGLYDVQLVVHRGLNCTDTLFISSFIEVNPSPTAAFTNSNPQGCEAPLPVNFTDASTGGVVAWLWNFGDGNTSTLQSPSHTYTAPGSYTVTLTVTNNTGCSNTISQPALVQIIPPVAAFNFSFQQPFCLPRIVRFNDLSTTTFDVINAWEWDFGDGANSNNQNPNHTYVTPGDWTVTLIVFTSSGCSDTLVMPNLIHSGPDPVADFTAMPTTVCLDAPVSFTNNSANATGYFWNFGDGGTSTQVNPVHAYTTVGCYTVTLAVNNLGCTDTLVRTNYVCAQGTRASFTSSATTACDTPATFTFTNTSTGSNLAAEWDFGDGTTATTTNGVHTYHSFGTYTVQLISTDQSNGCKDTVTTTIRITKPVAAFTQSSNGGCAPIVIGFTNLSSGGATYQWSYGDGAISSGFNGVHQYLSSGTYTVRLIVTNAFGCRDTAFSAVPIVIHDVVPNFNASPRPTCPNTPITFTSTSTSDSPLVSWTWDLGDGNTATGPVTTHSYANPGSYTIRLNVTDALGCSDTRVLGNYIVITHPTPAFSLSSPDLCPGQSLQLTSTATGAAPLSYAWTFGDGGTSTMANPNHTYAANGIYTIQQTVTDANGCRDSVSHSVTIDTPVAAFTINPSSSTCPPLIATLSNVSTGLITSFTWDFGDGSPLVNNLPNPLHFYNLPGTYNVTLVVRTGSGCTDTVTTVAAAVVNQPMATFAMDRATTCPGQAVTFTMSPTGTYNAIWDFGDGSSFGSGDTITHTYSSPSPPGGYLPILVAQDTGTLGCQNQAPTQGPILVLPPPDVAFAVSDSALCRADSVFFTDQTAYGGGPSSFVWLFGDGGSDTVMNPAHFFNVPGTYTVTMSVTDTLGCSDTDSIVAAVRLYDYQAHFGISQTRVCVMDVVSFTDSSFSDIDMPITSWIWDFGDLTGGSGPNVNHQYADTGWYDVTLVITTTAGCMDTLLIPNAVHVQQPYGSFSISSDTTCIGIPLQWTLTASQGATPTWYFGNGDSILGGDTVMYAYPSPGTYTSSVGLQDSLGCRVQLAAPDTVTVLPAPVAAFAVDNLVHCHPDSVLLWDLTTYGAPPAAILWDFGDGNNGTGDTLSHFFAAPGQYDVTLTVLDVLGCSDTLVDTAVVTIHSQIADFTPVILPGCLPVQVNFTNNSTADVPIASNHWTFGDGSIGLVPSPSHPYADTGTYTVTLVITSAVGCADTFSTDISITLPPLIQPELWAATVEGDNQVAAIFHQNTTSNFATYELWRLNPALTHIATEPVLADTVLLDPGSSSLTSANSYRPQVVNVCLDSTALPPTTAHTTMDLMAMPLHDQNLLGWSAYQGWANVSRYDIFSVQDYDTTSVQYLGSVPGNVLQFTDSTTNCTDSRTYRIRAVGTLPQERSWSDTSTSAPVHLPPTLQPQMVTATVLNNLDVTVSWLQAAIPGCTGYELYRATDASSNWTSLGTLPPTVTQYDDLTASVGSQSYFYRIRVADSCGAWSVVGDFARSILLQIDPSAGNAALSWNPYGNWTAGVDHYELEMQSSLGGPWIPVVTLPHTALEYTDPVGMPSEPATCYRLTAYESGGNAATSRSNEVCFSQDISVPNTITPNGDGFNDVLLVRALSGYPGSGIDIYNRWGNFVYRSDDYQNDWGGTNGNTGAALPDGTYFWVLRVSDGRTLKGYVTILR